jgi:hypothetical protein
MERGKRIRERLWDEMESNINNVANYQLQLKEVRNAALEEAAQISDDWGNYNASVQIRSLKEE